MRLDDQLLKCLLYFCDKNKITYPGDEILAGLPRNENGHITADQFLELAKQLGFDAYSEQMKISGILKIKSPSILILKNNKVVILLGVNRKEALIIDPNNDFLESKIPLNALKRDFDGYRISLIARSTDNQHIDRSTQVELRYHWLSGIFYSLKKTYPYVIFSSLFINLLVFVVPIFIMNVYDRVIPNNAINTLWGFAIGALVFLILDLILKVCRGIMLDASSDEVKDALNLSLFKHNLNLKLGANELGSNGYLSLSQELAAVRQFLSVTALTVVVDLPFFILYLFIIYILSGILVLVPLIGILFMTALNFSMQPALKTVVANKLKSEMIRKSIYVESIGLIETVKSLTMEKLLVRRFSRAQRLDEGSSKSTFYQNISVHIASWIQQTFAVILVIAGAFLIIQNKLTVGALVASSLIASRALSMTQVSTVLFQFNRMRRALRNIDEIMKLPKDYDSNKKYFYKENILPKLVLENVSFIYSEADSPAVSNVNISINSGEHVSIIGNVGSGKTTLLKLLVNFIEPTSGVIWLDTFSTREIAPDFLRTHIHYMSSDCNIFRGSILDNLKIANQHATSDEIINAAKLTGVEDLALKSQRGYEMLLDEKGENISSGQRQSICLARAMLSQADIILLDEPTAYLDLTNGILQMKNFFNFCNHKTILMVTHRLDLCQLTERSIFFKDGCVAMDGKTDDVIRDFM